MTTTHNNPATGTVPVEYSIDANTLRSLDVTVDLSSLGVGTEWEFDCVHTTEDGTVSMLFYPIDDDEDLWEDELAGAEGDAPP